ncbi:MAG: HAMP domain-containing sensor histidine kinase [Eubacteriales bacterium]|nr:HAMP domain-containing sensor histidine kinase [Eubacteriales bacterium]
MTVRQKIRLSNVMMVLIPILFTAIVITVCLHTSLGSYWYTLEAMYSDENGIQFAQSMIYTYQKELWEYNWGESGQTRKGAGIRQSDEMTHLENTLSEMGYRFRITKNGTQIFSNLTENDIATGREVAGEAMETAKTLTASRYEVSVIKNTFWHGETVFCITAIHPDSTDGDAVNYLKNYLLRYVWGVLAFFVLLTVAVNGVLSWWISRSILQPLQLLSHGTREIRNGNLDSAVRYEKKDEFGEVCSDFEEMRSYLRESVQQRLLDEKRRRELITGISHDLRTPLTSIIGYLDGLLEGIADTPEKQLRYLKAIKTRTGSLVNLVESLSEYSRLDRDFHYHMEETDLREYVEQYLRTVRTDAEQSSVEIGFEYEEAAYPVRLDQNEFKRVFDNILTNTVKYRVKDSSRVRISLCRIAGRGEAELVIADDGPGVPQESLEQLFDSFYRVDNSRNRSEKGSGIGLAVVREIIRGHGGSVQAQNREGLAILIRLPCGEDAQNSPIKTDKSPHHGDSEKAQQRTGKPQQKGERWQRY